MIASDRALLLCLLELPTAGPLETSAEVRLWDAMRLYADAAADIGFEVEHFAPAATLSDLVPLDVGADFLACQPNLVLRRGPRDAPAVMFNVHLDTVAPFEPASFDGVRFHGRGAIDAKGPAVALLAGLRAAANADCGVLVQAVSGEEGGAMGTFGTRPLVEAGYVGALNVFCEPTGLRYLPRCTAAMTPSIQIRGDDAIDDQPDVGHNATVLLGFLAQHLAAALPQVPNGQMCVAGLHTGSMHNRVYGSGELLLNLSYGSSASARVLEEAVSAELTAGLAAFTERFGDRSPFRRTAQDAAKITELSWRKRGLPALSTQDVPLLDGLVPRWPDDEPAFTCDAIWLDGVAPAVVLGPGSLDGNNAHAPGEFALEADLDRFAGVVRDIVLRFAESVR
ncbi:hypothetical protein Lesp02_40260 [Lentzea sp. NBRC 105346]|uniref:M20/M25/M40 family metallo-hydrolase n=1 Tax=Lentzea sp. NBRC 105346 TaxID=3032205 RepID=UPI0024A23C95|nr:M20/M25/M40 family metallo-hydrolase [Lentzea sp. NBRC 105346]GLZ31838.1 hypothetical protein Lesp02_40260 [Lentzea sp. NBRC 105346]